MRKKIGLQRRHLGNGSSPLPRQHGRSAQSCGVVQHVRRSCHLARSAFTVEAPTGRLWRSVGVICGRTIEGAERRHTRGPGRAFRSAASRRCVAAPRLCLLGFDHPQLTLGANSCWPAPQANPSRCGPVTQQYRTGRPCHERQAVAGLTPTTALEDWRGWGDSNLKRRRRLTAKQPVADGRKRSGAGDSPPGFESGNEKRSRD